MASSIEITPSPHYWDEDDDHFEVKPSHLYGEFTVEIHNFSTKQDKFTSECQVVGGYMWSILVYPQGDGDPNHLSLFLQVTNYDKLFPGWSYFAQFTVTITNEDPKKSKRSDAFHCFYGAEHDWGWKQFIERSNLSNGFIRADTLEIEVQIQVIRERENRLFRCLCCEYRRKLVRKHLPKVLQIFRCFVDEKIGKLDKWLDDEDRWLSFSAFWREADDHLKSSMCKEKSDLILKAIVQQFFKDKEVTSTLLMDSLYSGLKSLEGLNKNKVKGKCVAEEKPFPIARIEKDTFILLDDVFVRLKNLKSKTSPPKDEKGPQKCTKLVERRLTELGRMIIEVFVLDHIFSNKIENEYLQSKNRKNIPSVKKVSTQLSEDGMEANELKFEVVVPSQNEAAEHVVTLGKEDTALQDVECHN